MGAKSSRARASAIRITLVGVRLILVHRFRLRDREHARVGFWNQPEPAKVFAQRIARKQ